MPLMLKPVMSVPNLAIPNKSNRNPEQFTELAKVSGLVEPQTETDTQANQIQCGLVLLVRLYARRWAIVFARANPYFLARAKNPVDGDVGAFRCRPRRSARSTFLLNLSAIG
jgi:hypothetical protein